MSGEYRYPLIAVSAMLICAAPGTEGAAEPQADILFSTVMAKEPGRYIGWPTIAKTKSGELLAVFSGDRDAHVCPWGKTELVRSADGGRTWSAPITINNTPLDDRDAGILVTRKGTIIISWFTSLAFDDTNYTRNYPPDIVQTWRRHAEKLGPEIRKEWLGSWVRRSTDGGKTWGEPIRLQGSTPHGPIELSDGRLLYVGRVLYIWERSISVEESRDDGVTWRRIATIPIAPGDDIMQYHEPYPVETSDGTLVVLIREQSRSIMMQSESRDGGKTWSVSRQSGVLGYPPHLLRLCDGRILLVYGHRRQPCSERACISADGGATWSSPITVAPALDGDLGYPASVELDDGSIFTIYYQKAAAGEKPCLLGTCWKLR